MVFNGHLEYKAEYECSYAYNDQNGSSCQCMLEDDGSLYMASYGGFLPGGGDMAEGGSIVVTHYTDGTRNVMFSYPDWMTVITDGIGVTTDACVVGDGENGYVTVDNISGEWERYSGSWDEFVVDYFESFFSELFVPLYGEPADGNAELVDLDDPGYQHYKSFAGYGEWWSAMQGNFYNDKHDIDFLLVAMSVRGGNMIKCVFVPSGADEAQFTALCNDVTDFDTAD